MTQRTFYLTTPSIASTPAPSRAHVPDSHARSNSTPVLGPGGPSPGCPVTQARTDQGALTAGRVVVVADEAVGDHERHAIDRPDSRIAPRSSAGRAQACIVVSRPGSRVR